MDFEDFKGLVKKKCYITVKNLTDFNQCSKDEFETAFDDSWNNQKFQEYIHFCWNKCAKTTEDNFYFSKADQIANKFKSVCWNYPGKRVDEANSQKITEKTLNGVNQMDEVKTLSENQKWDELQTKFKHFLTTGSMYRPQDAVNDGKTHTNHSDIRSIYQNGSALIESKKVEFITARIKKFTDSLKGTDRECFLAELYANLFQIDGIGELKQCNQNKDSSHEEDAKYNAAVHNVLRNIWRCLEDCSKKCISQGDRLVNLSVKYADVYQKLEKKIVGQDYAINEFVQACFDSEMYENDPNRPQAVFLFAGPPGVGKTFLSESVADLLGRPFKAFDMASYSVEKSEIDLIGSDKNFKNAGEGKLIEFVEDNPDAIILFDEIEKAHPDVTRLFLSILEGARLENKLLATNTDFSNTIIIFTTNAGREIYENNKKNLSATPTDVIIKELRKEKDFESRAAKFPPELCSRFASNKIVVFNHIGISDIVTLITRNMDGVCKAIEEKMHFEIEYDKRLALLLLMHFGNIDARVVTEKAKQFIKKEIYDLSRQLSKVQSTGNIRKISFSIDDSRITDKVKKFFTVADSDEATVAVVCDELIKNKLTEANIEGIRFVFIQSEEELIECDPDDVTFFLIDPYFEMCSVDGKIIGLDDYDSVGLRIIKTLLKRTDHSPVFMLENGRKVSQADKNTLYMRGVEDTVCFDECNISELITNMVAKQMLQKKCSAMLDRRKIFDFESLQELPDSEGTVRIKFYDITVKDSVNPEDKDLLIDVEERPNIKFDDVIGSENAKNELRDFIKYLENPKAYLLNAMAVSKGVLLYGPPGTGKTMLAKAMAGEAEATFISISAAKLRSDGEKSIERLFSTARKYAPAIIFIDEVDAIARKRTGSVLTAHEDSLLNMLLTQMDGFEEHTGKPVFVVAATNFAVDDSNNLEYKSLDPAFIRRFGSKILVDLPNKTERIQYLSRMFNSKGKKAPKNKVTQDCILNIAERTAGISFSTLKNIIELAYRNAARNSKVLDDEILDDAMAEYLYGEKRTVDDEQVYRTAVHEASHAFIYSLSGGKTTYLTVVSRGHFNGFMQHENDENKCTLSKDEFVWRIRTSLAGRVGETVVFGDADALNTGAVGDLQNASRLAIDMLTAYGMYENHLFSMPTDIIFKSNLLPMYVEKAEDILQQQEKECTELVKQGKEKIIYLAKALFEKGHLNQEEIAELLKGQ